MSPPSVADDAPPLAESVAQPDSPTGGARPRLTVRQMQLALEAARHHATAHAPVDGNAPVIPIAAAPEPALVAASTRPLSEPWLPDHDGPVSLTSAAGPRVRAAKRAVAQADRRARRHVPQQHPGRPARAMTLPPEIAAQVAASPPVVVVIGACGGAGATTVAVLFAAALASATGSILLAPGDTRGAATARAGAEGGDTDALSRWATRAGGALTLDAPGVAVAYAGGSPYLVAGASRRVDEAALSVETATWLIDAARASNRTALTIDWTLPDLPTALADPQTDLVVVAPSTSLGLLDAEYTVHLLEDSQLAYASLSLVTVDVRARARRRAGRAALARLRALNTPTTAVPFDPALADTTAIVWSSLRHRTRTAVHAGLSQLRPREDTP